MFAVKINDPWMEEQLTQMSKAQKRSRSSIAREILAKKLEDTEDYVAATAVMADIKAGRTKVISHEEFWAKHDLAD
jgi:predicted DNA-binding protein